MQIAWNELDKGILSLREKILNLYKIGLKTNKMKHWQNVHDLISEYLDPYFNLKWINTKRNNFNFATEKEWIDAQEVDEFPLDFFYLHLKKGIKQWVVI